MGIGLSSINALAGFKVLWKPIKRQIEDTLEGLDELLQDVEKESDVAEKVESSEARLDIKKISCHILSECAIKLLNPSIG